MNLKTITFFCVITAVSSLCIADTIIIDAEDSGSYDERGYHLVNSSSGTGISELAGGWVNNNSYFVFSIPELDADITEVMLSLELTYYGSHDAYEDIRISAISTPIDELVVSHTNSDTGMAPWIYDDLMDGAELGIMRVELADPLKPFIWLSSFHGQGPVFSCTLNETAIQMIQETAGSQFALGLSLIDTNYTNKEYINFKPILPHEYKIQQLQITTIPEPGTIMFVVTGSLLISIRNRKQVRG